MRQLFVKRKMKKSLQMQKLNAVIIMLKKKNANLVILLRFLSVKILITLKVLQMIIEKIYNL